jgi:hypothetical protein
VNVHGGLGDHARDKANNEIPDQVKHRFILGSTCSGSSHGELL